MLVESLVHIDIIFFGKRSIVSRYQESSKWITLPDFLRHFNNFSAGMIYFFFCYNFIKQLNFVCIKIIQSSTSLISFFFMQYTLSLQLFLILDLADTLVGCQMLTFIVEDKSHIGELQDCHLMFLLLFSGSSQNLIFIRAVKELRIDTLAPWLSKLQSYQRLG